MARKSGVKIEHGYPNYIAPYNLDKLSRRHHPLGNMPVYPTNTDPQVWYEESLASQRYKDLVDEWCRVHEARPDQIPAPGMHMNMLIAMAMQQMVQAEYGHHRELERIAERTVREYYHIDETEVLFDIEILDPTKGEKPADGFDFKKGEEEAFYDDPEFKPDFRDELIRRRLTNALIQGASLKGHYLFHMAHNSLEELIPTVTDLYNSGMITNDLNYYYFDDVISGMMTDAEAQAGGMQVDYSGDIPVIRCKAICFTVLMHEMIKGVTEVLFSVGLPKDPAVAQRVVDFCDTVLAEFWDIRLGPKMWELFYGLIDPDDHEFLKHVIVGVAQFDTEEFLGFMKKMFTGDEEAKKIVDRIIKKKKDQIASYAIEQSAVDTPEEDTEDDTEIDFSFLG